MVSIETAIYISCILVATVTTGAYSYPTDLGEIAQDLRLLTSDPDSPLTRLCGDRQTIIPECQKNSEFIQQMLSKFSELAQKETHSRAKNAVLDEENSAQFRSPAKRARDDTSRFYSNW